jgi:hypothetical protein
MALSNRERFKAIARFQRPGDLFLIDHILAEIFSQWVEQGAPAKILPKEKDRYVDDPTIREYFNFDNKIIISEIKSGWSGLRMKDMGYGIGVPDGSPLVPGFEIKIIAEDDRTLTIINGDGQTVKALKNNPFSMPMFMDWPVKDRASWEELKKRLDPNSPERWPADWDSFVKRLNNQDDPVVLQVGGFYHYPRHWIGSERILYMFYDNPSLLDDMMEHMLYMETEIIKRVVKDVKIDEADFAEDMAYKAGPLISPAMVKKFMVPRYKKITELLRNNGIDIIQVDSDGNIEQLIPLWLEGGINYVWPLEQAAGNDPVALRKKYGKELILGGGIDKRVLLKGKSEIRNEIMSKVPFLIEKGGYFPTVDHAVPIGVPFENYCYYINTLREAAGLDKLSF